MSKLYRYCRPVTFCLSPSYTTGCGRWEYVFATKECNSNTTTNEQRARAALNRPFVQFACGQYCVWMGHLVVIFGQTSASKLSPSFNTALLKLLSRWIRIWFRTSMPALFVLFKGHPKLGTLPRSFSNHFITTQVAVSDVDRIEGRLDYESCLLYLSAHFGLLRAYLPFFVHSFVQCGSWIERTVEGLALS